MRIVGSPQLYDVCGVELLAAAMLMPLVGDVICINTLQGLNTKLLTRLLPDTDTITLPHCQQSLVSCQVTFTAAEHLFVLSGSVNSVHFLLHVYSF
jgi:hypothetical protein